MLQTLKAADAMATIAVKDVEVARKFYGGTLGLTQLPTEENGAVSFKSGSSSVLVYESKYAGTNKATAATWDVGDEISSLVDSLRAKGVGFEHYNFPDARLEGDVHVMGHLKAAWCKDPDGNILAFVGR